MARILLLLLFTTVLSFSSGCHSKPSEASLGNIETVMTPGMEIWATTSKGKIGIRAGSTLKRTYFWNDGCKGTIELWPRKERWKGSLGIYYPGPGNTWWFSCAGIKRAVVQEGIQNFDSEKAIQSWLQNRSWIYPVHTDDGLVVGWYQVLDREQIVVEVWQLHIQGKKPQRLGGSQNALITVKSP